MCFFRSLFLVGCVILCFIDIGRAFRILVFWILVVGLLRIIGFFVGWIVRGFE